MSLDGTCSLALVSRSACVSATLALLISFAGEARALPSLRCETVEIVDRVGLKHQMQIPALVEAMKAIALTIVPEGTAADIRIETTFNSASGRINVAIRTWAETEAVTLESELVHWTEDFVARRRNIQPLKDADAAAFRQTIVKALSDLTAERASGVALSSEPTGLKVTVTRPSGAVTPINRNRTIAVLGCVKDGTELGGFVTFTEGRRVEFHQRASKIFGIFAVGGQAKVDLADATSAPPETPEPQESTTDEHQTPAAPTRTWQWSVAAILGFVIVMLGFRTWRRSHVAK